MRNGWGSMGNIEDVKRIGIVDSRMHQAVLLILTLLIPKPQ